MSLGCVRNCIRRNNNLTKVETVETSSLHTEDHADGNALLVTVIVGLFIPRHHVVFTNSLLFHSVIGITNCKHTGLSTKEQISTNRCSRRPYTSILVHNHPRSEEHTSELQSHHDLVCRLLLEKK